MKRSYKGLTEEEVREARARYGDNSLKKEKRKGFIRCFFENLGDPIIKILMAALALEVIFTLGRCNLYEVFGIIAAILIATTVSTVSEYGSERAFEKISAATAEGRAKVIRDGTIREIPSD
jgi:magnesium-transporting ATPase (P-type)